MLGDNTVLAEIDECFGGVASDKAVETADDQDCQDSSLLVDGDDDFSAGVSGFVVGSFDVPDGV